MPPQSAAMELKVLISILQQGTALSGMLNQVNQLSAALSKLQTQAGAGAPIIPGGGGLPQIPAAANAATASVVNLERAVNKVISAVQFLAGGFLALQGVRFLRGLADDAAKVEVATTVLRVVAQNAGYTADQIDEVDKSVQKLGITARASKEALTSFLQARLPLTYAKDLARASQDLAVISGKDSSETFKRLIVNIQQLDALGLRWMGIVVDRAAAEEKFKQKQEDTTKALNKRQQQEALMVEVLEKAKLLEGAYVNAMGDVSKQLTSLSRLTETYRVALGESLLPAYSAIVRVVSTTLDKLILLSQEFSANRERAQEWADVATTVATVFSGIILFIGNHLDQLVVLARWYLEWRLAILAINAAAAGMVWITRVIVLLNNMRIAWIALQNGMIGYRVALQVLGATSAQEAIKMVAVAAAGTRIAAAQAAVAVTAPGAAAGIAATGTAAAGVTGALSGLAFAWGSIAAVLAIPVVGYIIYKIRAAHEEEMKKPVMQRAAETAEGSVFGKATAENVEQLLRMGRAGGEIQEIYTEWRRQIDATGKSEEQLRQEFAKSVAEYRRETPLIANASVLDEYKTKIGEVREEVTRLTTEGEQLRKMQLAAKTPEDKRAIGIERATVARQLEERVKKLSDLQKEMIKAAETRVPLMGRDDVSAQIDKYDAAQVRYDKIRDTGTRKAVSHAQAEMEVEKAILEEMKKKIELRLKVEKLTDAERKEDEEALASIKLRMSEVSDRAERIRTSTETLFGTKFIFTPEGEVLGGEFGKQIGAFETLLDDAKIILEEEGAVPEQIAEKIKKGIIAMGQSANQPLDLTRLKKTLKDVQELGLPETGALGQTAIGLAGIGIREARFGIRAPLVGEGKEAVERFFAPQLSDAETSFAKLKALNASLNEELEDGYRLNLESLDEYFAQRIDRIEEEADAERNIQILRIEQARALVLEEEDPRARAKAELKVKEEERRLADIGARAELEADRLRNQRRQQRKELTKDVEAQVLGIRAQEGGTREALKQLEFQLSQERERLQKLRDPRTEDLITLKRLTGEAEILRKEREAALQAELAIQQTLQAQLGLQQRQRDAAAARDRAAVEVGAMTSFEAERRNNERIEQQMYDNRLTRASKERELASRNANFALEVEKKRQELAQPKLELTPEEQTRRLILFQKELRDAIIESEGAIVDLDVAWQDLAISVETAGERAQKAFVDGFANALTEATTNFHEAGKAWVSFAQSIGQQIVGEFMKAFTQKLFARAGLFSFIDRFMNRIFGGGGIGGGGGGGGGGDLETAGTVNLAGGGPVIGPGTGTSDSIPAMLSTGEHVMPAAQAAQFMPLLEGIRTGKILPFAKGGVVQSIAISPVIPRRYAAGGVVVSDGGASAVTPGGGGPGNMTVSLHPNALNMTMREWLEHEVVRQQGRR